MVHHSIFESRHISFVLCVYLKNDWGNTCDQESNSFTRLRLIFNLEWNQQEIIFLFFYRTSAMERTIVEALQVSNTGLSTTTIDRKLLESSKQVQAMIGNLM